MFDKGVGKPMHRYTWPETDAGIEFKECSTQASTRHIFFERQNMFESVSNCFHHVLVKRLYESCVDDSNGNPIMFQLFGGCKSLIKNRSDADNCNIISIA